MKIEIKIPDELASMLTETKELTIDEKRVILLVRAIKILLAKKIIKKKVKKIKKALVKKTKKTKRK